MRIGDPVTIVVATFSTSIKGVDLAASPGERILGIAFEDAAASSATTARTVDVNAHLRNVYWTGGNFVLGASDNA